MESGYLIMKKHAKKDDINHHKEIKKYL